MKIAFIGGVKFSLEILKAILHENYSVDVIFSYDESKIKFYSDYISFDEISKKHKIKNVKIMNINDEKNIELLKKIKPDLILVMGWSQLLKDEIIEIPRLGVIGSHPTELPKYRGRASLPWSIIKGLKESALTFFYITPGVDEGDILDQRKLKITDDEDATSLYEKMINLGKEMITNNLPLLEKGKASRIKQDPSKFIENWSKRTPQDGKIDWSLPAKKIHTLIRASTHPYPGAFTFFKNSTLKIWKSLYLDSEREDPGKILGINNQGVKIGTGRGIIILQKISLDESTETNANKIISQNDIGIYLRK